METSHMQASALPSTLSSNTVTLQVTILMSVWRRRGQSEYKQSRPMLTLQKMKMNTYWYRVSQQQSSRMNMFTAQYSWAKVSSGASLTQVHRSMWYQTRRTGVLPMHFGSEWQEAMRLWTQGIQQDVTSTWQCVCHIRVNGYTEGCPHSVPCGPANGQHFTTTDGLRRFCLGGFCCCRYLLCRCHDYVSRKTGCWICRPFPAYWKDAHPVKLHIDESVKSVRQKTRVLEVFCRLSKSEATDYDTVKEVMHKRYNLTEDGHRQKFHTCAPEDGENPNMLIVRLKTYLERSMKISEMPQTYDGL